MTTWSRGVPANHILGNLGLTVREPFETIMDYPHQRVINPATCIITHDVLSL